MKALWDKIDRWGPGVIALVTLLIVLWYCRFLEGRQSTLFIIYSERSQIESSLRSEIQTWQAYTVTLRDIMIKHGLEVPPAPKPAPINLSTTPDGKPVIHTRR